MVPGLVVLIDPTTHPASSLAEAQARFYELDQRETWIEGEINSGRGTPPLVAELAVVSGYAATAFDQLKALGGLEPPVDETD